MGNGPTENDLRSWLDAIDAELGLVGDRLRPLLEEREKLMERREIVTQLLESISGSSSNRGKKNQKQKQKGSTGSYVIEHAIELLEEEGGPLHINELHARFLQKGYAIPGSGAPVNITSHIRNSKKIVSTSRGIYDLRKRKP